MRDGLTHMFVMERPRRWQLEDSMVWCCLESKRRGLHWRATPGRPLTCLRCVAETEQELRSLQTWETRTPGEFTR